MTKRWLDSKTVRGTLMSLVPTLLVLFGVFGIGISNEELESIVEGIAALAGLIGSILAIYGRFTAKEDITF